MDAPASTPAPSHGVPFHTCGVAASDWHDTLPPADGVPSTAAPAASPPPKSTRASVLPVTTRLPRWQSDSVDHPLSRSRLPSARSLVSPCPFSWKALTQPLVMTFPTASTCAGPSRRRPNLQWSMRFPRNVTAPPRTPYAWHTLRSFGSPQVTLSAITCAPPRTLTGWLKVSIRLRAIVAWPELTWIALSRPQREGTWHWPGVAVGQSGGAGGAAQSPSRARSPQ
jgi:hypothetical protein